MSYQPSLDSNPSPVDGTLTVSQIVVELQPLLIYPVLTPPLGLFPYTSS